MKEEQKKDQPTTENVTDPKEKDNKGTKGNGSDVSDDSKAVVDENTETVKDSEKEYDDTDHEHRYKTPGSESEHEDSKDAENQSGKKTSEEQTKNTVK